MSKITGSNDYPAIFILTTSEGNRRIKTKIVQFSPGDYGLRGSSHPERGNIFSPVSGEGILLTGTAQIDRLERCPSLTTFGIQGDIPRRAGPTRQ